MSSLAISLVVTGVIVVGGVVGLVLQRVLPERYTMDKARDMIGGVVGATTPRAPRPMRLPTRPWAA
jgi:uncharacterized membrane protein YeaQ/YmgE (transglycosylase-associated protein family)